MSKEHTDPGQLRERVTIQNKVETEDDMGTLTDVWTDIKTVWASVNPVRGREDVESERVQYTQTYLITIRHDSTITTHERIIWRGITMNIRSVQNRDMLRKYTTLECEEGVVT